MIDSETTTTPTTEGAAPDPISNMDLVAELEKLAPPETTPAPPAEEQEKPAEGEEPAKEEPAEEPEAEPAPEAKEPEADEPPEAERDKRLDAIQKAERRLKEKLAADRAQFDRERAAFEKEWTPRIEAAQRFETLSKRAKYDAAGVLMALGLSADDLDQAARQAYAASTAGLADPRIRESAQREARERQYGDELSDTRRELAEMRAEMQRRDQAQHAERQVVAYLESVAKAATDDTPLVRQMLAKAPDRTRMRLHELAVQLAEQEDGEAPDPIDVVKALEKARRDELEELGIDLDSVIKTKSQNPGSAGETKTARTLGSDLSNPARPRTAPSNRRDEIAEVRRALEQGRLE